MLFGKSYNKTLKSFSVDKSDIEKNIVEVLSYAQAHTQYGQENIPKNIQLNNAIHVLNSLPLITSEDIAKNLNYFSSKEFNCLNSFETTTGGTGRNPTTIKLSNKLFGIEWAYVHYIWSHAGYSRKKHTKLTLRGISLASDKLIEYRPLYNEVVVDPFKLNLDNAHILRDSISYFNIQYIHGYPSLVKECIQYFNKINYKPVLKGVFLVSEGASVELKKEIKDYFGCSVISFYGQSERALLAADFDGQGLYKVFTSYGYPRVVDGELVVTSFVNKALPLINYKVGDGAKIIEYKNDIYLSDISSRWGKDFVYLSPEKKISTAALNIHSSIQSEIIYYQIHQYEFGEIELLVVPKNNSKLSPNYIIKEIQNQFSLSLKDFQVSSRLVAESDITKSQRGKMMYLVQHLPSKDLK